jgi:hypothetical protein
MTDDTVDSLQRRLIRAQEVIECLKAKCYRLTISNNALLKVIKDLTDLLYDKWDRDDK